MNLKPLISKAEKKGADFSDIRIQNSETETISLKNSEFNSIQKDIKFQYGVRIFYKGAWGFSYGNKKKDIESAFEHAFKLAKVNSKMLKEKLKIKNFKAHKDKIPAEKGSFVETDIGERIKLLLELSKKVDKKYVVNKQFVTNFFKRNQNYANSFGADITQETEHFNLSFHVVGKKNSKTRDFYNRKGMCASYKEFKKIDFDEFINSNLKKLKNLFIAKKAPAGKYPLVIDNTLSQVFFHEAVGHACEADLVLEDTSVLKKKVGKKIAPDFIKLTDNPLIKKLHGYFQYDDEGTKSTETVLIENGILKNYLNSIETASEMNTNPNGNARAQEATNLPYPRMSNTVLYPGEFKFKELFEGIKKGVYAKGSSGGIVEPSNGNFLFSTKEAYLIENGKITKPLLDVSFGGNILNTLKHIEKVGNDFETKYRGGFRGKKGQLVPVSGKSPHIKISEAMVGGENG